MSELELYFIKSFINKFEMIYRHVGYDPLMEHILEDLNDLVKQNESDVK